MGTLLHTGTVLLEEKVSHLVVFLSGILTVSPVLATIRLRTKLPRDGLGWTRRLMGLAMAKCLLIITTVSSISLKGMAMSTKCLWAWDLATLAR